MFSEALKILDRNTVKYMIEELQKEVDEQQKRLEEQQKKVEEQQKRAEEERKKVEEQKLLLNQKDAEIEALRQQLKQQSEEKNI